MKKYLIALLLALPSLSMAAADESTPEVNVRDSDFVAGKKALAVKNWEVAIDAFSRALKREANNADIHNYLGYSYRNLGQIELAFKHYHEALRLEPNHRGAHEYIGFAYLKVGQVEKSGEHLTQLEKICGGKCEEYEDLSKAIVAYKAKNHK